MLEVNHLSACFGEHVVFENLHLIADEKEIVSVIGPSGGGKSTFLNCINRFILEKGGSYTGKILLDGVETSTMPVAELRRAVCTVFQDARPFPLSIENNIHYVLDFYGIEKKEEATKRLLEQVGLYDEVKDQLKKPATKLSGGQKQRLCIARALACAPRVLLLDEPFSSLDSVNAARLEQLLLSLSKGMTILFVTHNIEQAHRIADHVFSIGTSFSSGVGKDTRDGAPV